MEQRNTSVEGMGAMSKELIPASCWSCGGRSLTPIFAVSSIPLSSLMLMETQEEAQAFPRGQLELVVCTSCGFIYNQMFRPEVVDYTMPYESSQDFSPRFRVFKQELIDHLIEDYELAGKEILEIGCGDASFLEALCAQAEAQGFGIDPNFDIERVSDNGAVSGIREFFDADQVHLTGDLICCRHTLEHIQPVGEFVDLTRQSAQRRENSVVFYEIPDTDRILEEGAFWDVYYEHCSYFTLPSLANLFRSKGFEILRLEKGYDDQYLLVDCVLGRADDHFDSAGVRTVVDKAQDFGNAASIAVDQWRELVTSAAESDGTVVLWGASSKAVAFLASIGIDDAISAAVDINPFKQNKFLPGSGHPVIGPESLPTLEPDLVVIMNPIYVDEIARTLESLGLSPELRALGEEIGDVSEDRKRHEVH